MQPIRIIEEMHRHRWAITREAFDAIRQIVDGIELSADDHRYFHALEIERKSALSATFGKRVDGARYSSTRGNVGFIMMDGPIIPRATWFSDASGMVSLDTATNEFKALEANQNIDTIVHLMDTPGGVVTGGSDYAALIRASSKKTYTFAWMAASLGYLIGAASKDGFVLSESGIAGSIGTVITLVDSSKADERRGVRYIDVVSSQSPNKRPDHTTPEGMAVYQKLVDDDADIFIASVEKDRGVGRDTVINDFGGGAMLTAQNAVDVGMADKVKDIEAFVSSLMTQKRAGLFISNPHARAEGIMTTENQVLTAEQVRAQYPAAVEQIEQAARAEGANGERARLQAIEAISEQFRNSQIPSVRAAVDKVISESKFQNGPDGKPVSVGDVNGLVVAAIATAQNDAISAAASPRADLATAAEHASTATAGVMTPAEQADADASQRRQSKLKAARDKRLGKGGENNGR